MLTALILVGDDDSANAHSIIYVNKPEQGKFFQIGYAEIQALKSKW